MKQPMSLTPRKRAQQARSAETVKAILQATVQVLETHGAERTTTNKIADRAGVSVGSVYEYFPNKRAIFAELGKSFHLQLTNELRQMVRASAGEPLRRTVSACVGVVLREHARYSQVHHAAPPAPNDSEVDRNIARLSDQVLALHADELATGLDTELARIVCVGALEGGVHAALESRPDSLGDGSLREELTTLLTGYLTSAGGPQEPR